jgi:hypothetical protein
MRRVFVHFLEEIEDTQKTFRNYLTFKICSNIARFLKPIPLKYVSVKTHVEEIILGFILYIKL